MKRLAPARRRVSRRPSRRGCSLIEAAFSIVIITVMFAAVITSVASARLVRYKTDGRSRGSTLAHDLMAEILQAPYEEPDGAVALGRDSGESGGNRADFDDIDDYDTWKGEPPELKDGTLLSLPAGWSRWVEVQWIVANNFTLTSGTETDVKRIIVTVKHKNVTMAQITAIRTRAFPELDR